MKDLAFLFDDFLIVISIIIPLLFLKGFARNGKAYKIFTLYLCFIALIQFSLFVYSIMGKESIFIFHFYFIGQFIFLIFFYKELLKTKRLLYVLPIVLLFLGYTYWENPSIIKDYHTLGVVLTHSIIVFLAMRYYYLSLSSKGTFLYVNSGIVIYFLSSILYFASMNSVLNLGLEQSTQLFFGAVNDFLYLVFVIIIFIEWNKNYRKVKQS